MNCHTLIRFVTSNMIQFKTNFESINMLFRLLLLICISNTFGFLDTGPFCKTGWEWFAGKCYQINTPKPKVTWSSAKNNCEKQGAKLFLPLSENVDDGIWDLYTKAGGAWNYWLNVKDLQENLE